MRKSYTSHSLTKYSSFQVRDAAKEHADIKIIDLLEGFSSSGDATTALSYDGLR